MSTLFQRSVSYFRGALFLILAIAYSNPASGKKIVIEVPYHIKSMTHTHTVYKLIPEKNPSAMPAMQMPPAPPPTAKPPPKVPAAPARPLASVMHHIPVHASNPVVFPEHRARLSFTTRGVPPGHDEHLQVKLKGTVHHTETRV